MRQTIFFIALLALTSCNNSTPADTPTVELDTFASKGLVAKTLALSVTASQVTTMVNNAVSPLATKVTTLTNTTAAQAKTIATLQAQLKAYSVDSSANKKALADLSKLLLIKDTQITNLNKNYTILFDQNGVLYTRTDTLNNRTRAVIGDLQKYKDSAYNLYSHDYIVDSVTKTLKIKR